MSLRSPDGLRVVEVRLDQLVRFDVAGWHLKPSDDPSVAIWMPPDGNGVGIYYFAMPPDLVVAATLVELAAAECEGLHPNGSGLVEIAVVGLRNSVALRKIIKTATDPTIALARSGLTYIASLTIPFRGFSFVIKTQAREVGPTSTRESAVLARELAAQRVRAAGPGNLEGWIVAPEPGMPQLDANVSELAPHDELFPNHPLTKVRALIDHVQASLVLDDVVAGQPQFPLPRA